MKKLLSALALALALILALGNVSLAENAQEDPVAFTIDGEEVRVSKITDMATLLFDNGYSEAEDDYLTAVSYVTYGYLYKKQFDAFGVNEFTPEEMAVVSSHDMGYSGSRMPANITFTYNQNDGNTNIGYGRGWRCCYSQYLELVRLAGVYYYKWIDGDGTRIYFTYDDEESKWTDENGLGYTLSLGTGSFAAPA